MEESKKYNTYTIGKHLIIYNSEVLTCEFYECNSYYGIIFKVIDDGDNIISKDGKYDIVYHFNLDWIRLVINNKCGSFDLPFHEGTFRFLPPGVEVLNI